MPKTSRTITGMVNRTFVWVFFVAAAVVLNATFTVFVLRVRFSNGKKQIIKNKNQILTNHNITTNYNAAKTKKPRICTLKALYQS